MWEVTQICGKWLKYVGKWVNYLTNGLKMWKMTLYLRNGFTMLAMA